MRSRRRAARHWIVAALLLGTLHVVASGLQTPGIPPPPRKFKATAPSATLASTGVDDRPIQQLEPDVQP